MYRLIQPFGYHISSNSIGKAWFDLVTAIVNHGEIAYDEGRQRICLQNVRIRIKNPRLPDKIIDQYADKKNIQDIVYLTFRGKKMYDFDVKPSFSPGAKSYYARIKEGQMDKFIIERLSKIPESKKAVISFIHWDDYKAVLKNPYDDYLPCIVSIQFRLLEKKNSYLMNVMFNSRSIDAYQKSNGNIVAITILANTIAEKLANRFKKEVSLNMIDGFITDAHIYQDCYTNAKALVKNYKFKISLPHATV